MKHSTKSGRKIHAKTKPHTGKRKPSKKYSTSKKHSHMNTKKRVKHTRNARNTRNTRNIRNKRSKQNKRSMRGGNVGSTIQGSPFYPSSLSIELQPVPFVPPGGGYKVGASTNGLDGGYYYNLATPDFHAPNGTAKTSNDINVNGKPLARGKFQKGGGLIPSDLKYLYRSAGSTLANLYNGVVGNPSSPSSNPNPMYQPNMTKPVALNASVADVNTIMNNARREASM